ncbi:ligand-gated channel protein [Pasteurellaceae bacterium LFhippo2]|nr:ligand-gated channel protein [Pasteurellaceae bacterium LFhippo2]
MKFKHSLIYTALFAVPAMAIAEETTLSEVTVTETNQLENNEGSYQSRQSNIANKGATPLIDSSQTVNVVNSQLIADRQPQSIDEALATVSGTTQANTLGGLMDAVLKRGFGANRDNSILRNGVVAGPSHNFSATTERVEVLKGPASVLYGIQDPGGVINVVTKKPQQEAKYVLGTSVGSNNAWGVNFDATGGLGNGFAYRFIYDQNDKDYWRNFGEVKRTLYAPSLSWANDKTEITVGYEHQEYTDPFDRGTYIIAKGTGKGTFAPISSETRLDEPFNEATGKIDVISVNASHKLNDFWKLNATYAHTRDTYNYWQARVTTVNLDRGTAVRRLEGIQGSNQRNDSASINAVGEFATGDVAHRVVAGVDLARTTLDIRRHQGANSTVDLYNPVYGSASVADMPLAANNAHQYARLKTVGVYVQDSAYLTDKLIVSGGVRYEYYDQEAGRGGTSAPERLYTDDHGGKLLYQAGAVYKFTPDWAVYGNYAQSFRPQLSRAAVTEGIQPERGQSFEVGTKYENAFLSTNLALFNIDKKNVTDTYAGTDGNNYQYVVGKVNSRGLEWDIHGRLSDKVGVTATYAYTKTKTRENSKYPFYNGKEFEGVPKHQASLFLTYDVGNFSFGNIRVGAGGRYLGTWKLYNTNDSANIETYKLPHAVVADAFVAYDTKLSGKKVSLQLNGKNLGNKTYYVSTQGTNNNVIPVAYGNKREWLLNAKVEF